MRSRRNGRKGNRNSKRSMRPVSESLRGQWRWFLIRLLILIGILYVLFGCIFGITTVKNEDMDPRISAGDLVLYYRLDKKPVAGDVICLLYTSIRHFAFAVENTDACVEAVRTAGYEVFVEPKDIEIASEIPFPARIAFCRGPVGEEIEFFHDK